MIITVTYTGMVMPRQNDNNFHLSDRGDQLLF